MRRTARIGVNDLQVDDGLAPASTRQRQMGKKSPSIYLQTALIMALALAARVYLLSQSRGMMDSDEAVLGIQAERILRGAHPIYFYGQAYMGSWDAYLAAPLIAIFGPSAAILHIVTSLEALLLVPLMGALATRMFHTERARLPAMLLAAVPPVYVSVGEMRMLGGYVETLVLGTAMMLVTLSIADYWAVKRSTRTLWQISGLLVGFSFWLDPLIIYYVLACALWLTLPAFAQLRWRVGDQEERAQPWWVRVIPSGTLTAALAFLSSALVGVSPAIWYAITTPAQSVPYIGGGSAPTLRAWLRPEIIGFYIKEAIPWIAGITTPWGLLTTHALRRAVIEFTPGMVLLLVVFAIAPIIMGAVRVFHLPYTVRRHAFNSPVWANTLLIILSAVIALIYWRNPASVFLSPSIDTMGRYLLPMTTVITLAIVYLYVAAPPKLAVILSRRSRSKPLDSWLDITRILSYVALALLLLSYGAAYIMTDKLQAFESPYDMGLTFPAENSALIPYLQQQHIRYLWSDHWQGNVIMYLTDEQIVTADYVNVTVMHGPDRFADLRSEVIHADRPSFLIRTESPWPQAAMVTLGVKYTAAQFGDLQVVTPLSRTVSPSEFFQAACKGAYRDAIGVCAYPLPDATTSMGLFG